MYVDLSHTKFKRADSGVFTRTVVADCMSHQCSMQKTGTQKLDACCQYGCDVDLFELHAIMAHADDIRAVLRPDAPGTWFDDKNPEVDPDAKSGMFVRTLKH